MGIRLAYRKRYASTSKHYEKTQRSKFVRPFRRGGPYWRTDGWFATTVGAPEKSRRRRSVDAWRVKGWSRTCGQPIVTQAQPDRQKGSASALGQYLKGHRFDIRHIVMAKRDDYKACVAAVAASASADVLLCNARIERDIDDDIIKLCHARRRRPNVFLILSYRRRKSRCGVQDCPHASVSLRAVHLRNLWLLQKRRNAHRSWRT
jgi:hypothetical protein